MVVTDAYPKDAHAKDERKYQPKEKVEGDSGITCHFCGVKNHYAKDCLLKKQLNQEREPEGKPTGGKEIGRASCRERVCQYV